MVGWPGQVHRCEWETEEGDVSTQVQRRTTHQGWTITHTGDNDEHGLVDELALSKEAQAEVDEDEVLGEGRQAAKDVARRALRAVRHVVVGVVLERDAAEEERDDACAGGGDTCEGGG